MAADDIDSVLTEVRAYARTLSASAAAIEALAPKLARLKDDFDGADDPVLLAVRRNLGQVQIERALISRQLEQLASDVLAGAERFEQGVEQERREREHRSGTGEAPA